MNWTKSDNRKAAADGWCLMKDDHAGWQIQAIDAEEAPFQGLFRDKNAATYVQGQANTGNELAQRAIEFLMQENSTDVRDFSLSNTWIDDTIKT